MTTDDVTATGITAFRGFAGALEGVADPVTVVDAVLLAVCEAVWLADGGIVVEGDTEGSDVALAVADGGAGDDVGELVPDGDAVGDCDGVGVCELLTVGEAETGGPHTPAASQ